MAMSGMEQECIQESINSASPEERQEMARESEAILSQINVLMGQRLLSKDENHAADSAIEILMRIEATEKGKGWWYRTKRRLQLTQFYLGS